MASRSHSLTVKVRLLARAARQVADVTEGPNRAATATERLSPLFTQTRPGVDA